MDAVNKEIYLQIEDLRKMWRELWWAMAAGGFGEYQSIKGLEVLEFWGVYDLWKEKIKTEHEHLKAQQAGRKK